MKFRRFIKKARSAVLAGILMISALPLTSLAANEPSVKVKIGVEVQVTGEAPNEAEEFYLEMTKKDADAPLPDSTTVMVKGSGKTYFNEITYTNPGEYTYEVRERKNTSAVYDIDDSYYTVEVTIVREENGRLDSSIKVSKNGSIQKSHSLVFVNEYIEPESPNTPNEPEPDTPTPDTPSNETPTPNTPSNETPTPDTPSNDTPSNDEPSSDTPQSEESSSEPETTPSSTPNRPNTPNTPNTPSNPNEPKTPDKPVREEPPYIPVIPELVVPDENNDDTDYSSYSNYEDYINIEPDPVPQVSLTSLDDEDVPLAVLLPNIPITGDTFNMVLWIVLLAGSAVVILFITAKGLKDWKKRRT